MIEKLTIIIFILCISGPAHSGKSDAQLNAEVLDTFCIQNQDNFENIVYMAKSFDGRVLPNEQGDPALREFGGKTVQIYYEDNSFLIAYSNVGGCSVATKNIDYENLVAILEKHFRVKLVDKQASLSQINEYYRITQKSSLSGAIISIVSAQPETGYTDGSISFLPAKVAKRVLRK